MRGGMARELIGLNMASMHSKEFWGSPDRFGASFDMHISLQRDTLLKWSCCRISICIRNRNLFFPLPKKIDQSGYRCRTATLTPCPLNPTWMRSGAPIYDHFQSRLRPAVLAWKPSSAILATVSGMMMSFLKRSCCNSSNAFSVGPG